MTDELPGVERQEIDDPITIKAKRNLKRKKRRSARARFIA
ncbi:unnamed protein product [Ciceribacter sp. T2.26MG-112.2]|nr:unnamed protein product [Ciceribacter naphthalenivorans]